MKFYHLAVVDKQIEDLLNLLENYEKLTCEELPETLSDIKLQLSDMRGAEELKRDKNELNDELNELSDEKIISFLLPGNPDTATAQQKGVRIVRGQPQFFEKSTVARAKARLSWLLKQTRPKHPYTGAVELQVEWRFARGSKPKRFIGTFKKTRPDLDNMLKGFMDVMGDLGYFEDDAQVCRIMLSKVWVDDPDAGIYVQIREMDDNVLGGSEDDG